MSQITRYFAGGNTAEGFASFFPFVLPEESCKRMFYIKGGPGVGKSSFMKVIGAEMEAEGYDVEYFFCSGDPESLDAVTIPALGVGIMDATAPHSYDPAIPGARDTLISLGDYLDEEAMSPFLPEIAHIGKHISMYYRDCYCYLGAAMKLKSISHTSEIRDNIYMEKSLAMKRAHQLTEQYLLNCAETEQTTINSEIGSVRKLFGEAYTHMGYISYVAALPRKRTVLLLEPDMCRLDILLQELMERAVRQNIDVIALCHPLKPALLSHLYMPEEQLLFTSDESLRDIAEICDLHPSKSIPYEHTLQEQNYEKLIHYAVNQLKSAKKAHDELETYYVKHMDFDRVSEKLNEVLMKIKSIK